ncbi:DUF456 domain-containing protein [Nocardioides sp. CFH 31398]|uniref:DUF456 domain-containing protein n=1 Tax=Nocardioides sp. CFH 31398 TaxID=2919579 RepID=UPI001F0669BE|nr:DUF456 domain-containing protein [Nocardioides sp. CFH 31398]MCH1868352.1 DUF456 domain-containing protein [Nocardioides sp. CFH 31398]
MIAFEVVIGAAILLGIVGTVVPVLPGAAVVAVAVVVWAVAVADPVGWSVMVAALAILGLGTVLQYLLPGRRLQAAGVPNRTLWIAAAVGVVGFFVIPLVGLFVGFVVGVYAAEHQRLGRRDAWPSTVHALKAVGLSILIELTACLLAAVAWGVGVYAT